MPFQFHEEYPPQKLEYTRYGFFTNEKGSSDGRGYLSRGEKTRNVNLYSPDQDAATEKYDSPTNVAENIDECFQELFNEVPNRDEHQTHKIFMTTNYAKGGLRIVSYTNLEALEQLKETATSEISKLELKNGAMVAQLKERNIHALRADGVIITGIKNHAVAVGGASADAHPIIIIDDANKICAYLSGAHSCLKAGVLQETLKAMVEAGADKYNTSLLIGPGLGPNSYEFGSNAPEYFKIPEGKFRTVTDDKNQQKLLININEVVRDKVGENVTPTNIYNMEIDTMTINLYREDNTKKENISFTDISNNSALFFSARRHCIKNYGENNDAFHNEIGRHGAAVCCFNK